MPSSPDLDLRLVRYFTAVADHLHFGRAAVALGITQPSLSRQIRGLERQLGARLFDRTTRGIRLTDAGAAFLPLARSLLGSAAHAVARTRAAAAPGRLTVGHTVHLVVTPAVRAMRHRYPDAEVRTTHLPWNDAPAALAEHRVDVVVARMPFPADGLDVTVLYEQPRVLLVPRDHRLAGKESARLDDIADEPIPRMPEEPEWEAFWRVDPRPGGRPAPDGPLLTALEDKYELIAGGEAVAIVPGDERMTGLHPELTTVPLEDVEPCQVALATRAGDTRRLVAAFRRVARAVLTVPAPADG